MSFDRGPVRGRGRGFQPSNSSSWDNNGDGWGLPINQNKRAAQSQPEGVDDGWGAPPQSKSQSSGFKTTADDDDWGAPVQNSVGLKEPAPGSFDDDWGVPMDQTKAKAPSQSTDGDWGSAPSSNWRDPQRPSTRPRSTSRSRSSADQPSGNGRIVRVPSGRVGAVIGRGGSKITELQERSGARIKVLRDDDNGVDVGVQVSGSADQMDLAERMIEDLTKDHSRSDSDYPERRSGGSSSDLVMKVPTGSVGRIIGRSGAKIHELQDKSGARIKVPREEDDGYEATVRIIGDPDKQKAAEALIKELLEDNPYPSNSTPAVTSQPEEEENVCIDWAAAIANSKEATKARWAKAPPIQKSFYVEDPEVALMPRDNVDRFKLEHNNIMTSHYKSDDDRPIPNPVTSFKHAFVHYPELLQAVENQGFSDPSPIQCQSWPILLKGYDMIGIAQTGTGKTLAFLLPALVHIEGQPTPRNQRDGPTVLVMAPTRELAQQIEREVRKFPYRGITCVCVYGGGDRKQQIGTVAKGVEIVVATPGRLYDLMKAGALKTSSVSYCVLDEADRMLDLGFEPQIKKILNEVRPDRQMIMTSATWPEGIRRIANDYMDNPIQVCVGTLDLAAVHSITQHVEIMAEEDKRERLKDFIHSLDKGDKAIVFVGRKMVADQIASELSLAGIICQCIHGDRDQIDREQALEDLRNGDVNLLIATDVASRGIDIKDITHILNYDFPRHAEEYVHRVGRTGRAGRSGIAISFMTREDWAKAAELISILEEAGQEVPKELLNMSERFAAWKERKDEERRRNGIDMGRGGGGGGGGGRGCHKCGQEGHFARECPSGGGSSGGGGGGGRGCHKCGQEGHFARECPTGGGGGGGGGRGGGFGGGGRRGGGRGGGGRFSGSRRDDPFGDFF